HKAIIIARFTIINILKLLKNWKKLKIDSAIIITLENKKYNQNSFRLEIPPKLKQFFIGSSK
ncbi:MAG: hypothetical protein J0L55_14215, partial [Caulobacterales bacterium]|nr:hypothetical protein [Caulobacterales bacterium]